MKASELTHAQPWCEVDGERCMLIHSYDLKTWVARKVNGWFVATWLQNSDEVTPLPDCTGWDWQPPQEQSYAARQAAWVEANGVKVWSMVKVVSKDEDEENGWPLNWCRAMDKYVDSEFRVDEICDDGISDGTWFFPYFVLEPVEPAPQDTRAADADYVLRWCYQSHTVPANIHDLAARALGEPSLAHGFAEVEPAPQPPLQVREAYESLLAWAIQRRSDEVDNRPDENIFKRTIAGTWGQVIRKLKDLIAEVPPPSESPVMETPDKVAVEPTVEPGEGWRWLEYGERIEEGDEYRPFGDEPFQPIEKARLGGRYSENSWPIRRRITPEPEREATYRAFRSAEDEPRYKPFDHTRFVQCLIRAVHRPPRSLAEADALRAIEDVFVAAFVEYGICGVRESEAKS